MLVKDLKEYVQSPSTHRDYLRCGDVVKIHGHECTLVGITPNDCDLIDDGCYIILVLPNGTVYGEFDGVGNPEHLTYDELINLDLLDCEIVRLCH